MTDREMLEMAAKAAGYQLDGLAERHVGQAVWPEDYLLLNEKGGHSIWNPLRDDGDALRLAVKLRITDLALAVGEYVVSEKYREGDSIETITRRAIVRAAAEIGKAMP